MSDKKFKKIEKCEHSWKTLKKYPSKDHKYIVTDLKCRKCGGRGASIERKE